MAAGDGWIGMNPDWIGNLFWLFLALALLTPLAQRRLLQLRRDGGAQRLARARGSRVLTLIEHRETYRFLGVPFLHRDAAADPERLLRAIALAPKSVPLDLILHTPGGEGLAAEQIAHALIRHPARVTVFVPHYALGGGTLLALAADEIALDPNAVLGPVEARVGPYPASAVLAAAGAGEARDARTLILAGQARKAQAQTEALVAELLLAGGASEERAAEVAGALTGGAWTPGYPIMLEEAQRLGLPVNPLLPPEVYALLDLYDTGPRSRPSTGAVRLDG